MSTVGVSLRRSRIARCGNAFSFSKMKTAPDFRIRSAFKESGQFGQTVFNTATFLRCTSWSSRRVRFLTSEPNQSLKNPVKSRQIVFNTATFLRRTSGACVSPMAYRPVYTTGVGGEQTPARDSCFHALRAQITSFPRKLVPPRVVWFPVIVNSSQIHHGGKNCHFSTPCDCSLSFM